MAKTKTKKKRTTKKRPRYETDRRFTLTDEEVREIRFWARKGWSSRELAVEYGISPSQAHKIIAGKSRRDVEVPRGYRPS